MVQKENSFWFILLVKISFFLPLVVSLVAFRAALRKAERKFGGAGRLGIDVTTGFVIVDVAVVIVVDGFNNVFVTVGVERLFAVADVKFPFACARIWATSGETSPNENVERLGGVTVLVVVVGIELFVDTKGIFVVVLLLFTDVTLFDTDDDVS